MIVRTRIFVLALIILVTTWSVGLRRLWKNTEALWLLKLIEPLLSRVDYNFMSRSFVSITLTRTRKESKLKCARFVRDYRSDFLIKPRIKLSASVLVLPASGLADFDSGQTEAGNGLVVKCTVLSLVLDSTFSVNSLDSLGGLN